MIAPYQGKFKVTQPYKGAKHDGLDLVGLDSKTVYATVSGVVQYAGWENVSDHTQGFGQYVKIKQDGTNDSYYFGHLSRIAVSRGQHVAQGTVLGTEGSTGKSTGSHLHYCVRAGGVKGNHKDISVISGIPNAVGTYTPEQTDFSGTWVRDSVGWWYRYTVGGYPKARWLKLDAWYYFDEQGYALQNTTLDYKGKTYTFGNDCRCKNP